METIVISFRCNLNKNTLREVIVKIGLKRIDIPEEIMVGALLDSMAIYLVMSSEFTRKQMFKLKKIERLIYVRNVDSTFNREKLIKYTVEVNILYKEHRESV